MTVLIWLASVSVAAVPAEPPVRYFPDPSPNAPYSTATQVGEILYLAGQTGEFPDGTLPDGFDAQAKRAMANIGAVLKARGLTFDDVFKCTVMLQNMSDWPRFNEIYVPHFKPGRLPSRSALGASGLAGGALIEVECWAYAE